MASANGLTLLSGRRATTTRTWRWHQAICQPCGTSCGIVPPARNDSSTPLDDCLGPDFVSRHPCACFCACASHFPFILSPPNSRMYHKQLSNSRATKQLAILDAQRTSDDSQSAGLSAATAADMPICVPVSIYLADAGIVRLQPEQQQLKHLYPSGGPFPSNDAHPDKRGLVLWSMLSQAQHCCSTSAKVAEANHWFLQVCTLLRPCSLGSPTCRLQISLIKDCRLPLCFG